jgi:hypothetical protein
MIAVGTLLTLAACTEAPPLPRAWVLTFSTTRPLRDAFDRAVCEGRAATLPTAGAFLGDDAWAVSCDRNTESALHYRWTYATR